MGMRIRRNFAPLTDLKLSTRADMEQIGLLARERILRRTRQGLDYQERPFRPYSAAYGERKRAALGSGGTVDLKVSGGMVDAVTIVALTDTSVTLGFSR